MKRTNANVNQIAEAAPMPFVKEVATGKIYEVTSDAMAPADQAKILRIEEVGSHFWTTLPFTSIIDGTYTIVSKEEAEAYKINMEGNKMNNQTVENKNTKEATNMYKGLKKDELIALLMEKDATIAAQAARLDKAVVEFKKIRAEKVALETRLAPKTGSTQVGGTVTASSNGNTANSAPMGNSDSGVICKICGKQHLTKNVLGFCNRKLDGEHVCMGCQKKLAMKPGADNHGIVARALAGETPASAPAPQAPATQNVVNAGGVALNTVTPELLQQLMAAMKAQNTNAAINPTNIGF